MLLMLAVLSLCCNRFFVVMISVFKALRAVPNLIVRVITYLCETVFILPSLERRWEF